METGEIVDHAENYRVKTACEFILQDLKSAWRHAVRAMNGAENAGLTDTATDLQSQVAKLSATLEFCETMAQMEFSC